MHKIPNWLVGLAVILFLTLGGWQVQRLQWKTDLIETSEENYHLDPLVTSQIRDVKEAGLFRQVQLMGTWQYDDTLRVIARYHDKELGYHLITPLVLDGGRILVNRGWVIAGTELPTGTAPAIVNGVLIHGEGAPPFFLPQHNPEVNEWISLDEDAMVTYLGNVNPLVVQQTVSGEGEPLAQPFELRFWNQHLEYAIMWFTIALVTVLMQVIARRKTS